MPTHPDRPQGAAVAAGFLLLAAVSCRAPLQRFEYHEASMGTTFRIVLYADDPTEADWAARTAFARIQSLDDRLSDYQPDSEISRLSTLSSVLAPTPWVSLSHDLAEVLRAGQEMARRTGGAFDVTIGPLVRLWRRSRRQGELPHPTRLKEARHAVGHRFLELSASADRARLLRANMKLDVGGIAKGYAVDQALAALAKAGITRALVDGGGDIGVSGPPPGLPGWQIALHEPEPDRGPGTRSLCLAHAAVATSGDTYRFVEIAGVRYSHLIDPGTGLGLRQHVAVTVVADHATQADAWASAASILGARRGLALIEKAPGVEAWICWQDRGEMRTCHSTGWQRMMDNGSKSVPSLTRNRKVSP